MSRALGAVASQVVGRIVRLHPDGGRGAVIRVTGRGMVVRMSNGQTRTDITHTDIQAWED
jgi:hypothetical protein